MYLIQYGLIAIRAACWCKISAWQTWRVDLRYITDYVESFHAIPVVYFLHSLCESYIIHGHLLGNQYINQQTAHYEMDIMNGKPQNITFVDFSSPKILP